MTKWFEHGERLNFSLGIEDTFIPQTRPGMRALDEYELTGHYEHWHEDLGLISETGANQVRWGIPWYLVNPEPGVFRFDWLDQVVDRFEELGVDVIVDLMHYGTPLWMDNSFINHDYPQYVAEYAATVAERYRGRLNIWTPLNEPLLNMMYCGQYGYWPPYLTGDDGFVKLFRQITRGMILTQNAIADVDPEASFVNVEASFRFGGDRDAYRDEIEFLEHRRFLVEDTIMGRVDDSHPLAGWLARHGLSDDDLQWYRDHAVMPDVIGVNYYPQVSTVNYVAGDPHDGSPYDPMPFRNDGVEGLKEVLTLFSQRYGLPVYLTETCSPGPVEERIRWLHESVAAVDGLRSEGMNLIGYTWWSLFDMMYWVYRDENKPAEHYLAQMGLWDLRANDRHSFDRVRTAAVDVYRQLADAHRA
ncbi:family 1 glycosylhydrolase [Bifidobacterium simiiventris]|uniref:family 1 glycosylhydrolase n=1 Tax=Bifidobacterium simiiventris TaxID=2834434 RepID=UPI001C59B353|nr:family 1 glycosylhydrolase [Bifidobacterium simiiventris]MBW3078478.1 glycoside hydrolase family 1 protein [Bifidobacterium simiiventris]